MRPKLRVKLTDQTLAQKTKSVAQTALLHTGLKQNLNSSLPFGLVVSFAAIIRVIKQSFISGGETLCYNPNGGCKRDYLDRQCLNFDYSRQVLVFSLLT